MLSRSSLRDTTTEDNLSRVYSKSYEHGMSNNYSMYVKKVEGLISWKKYTVDVSRTQI